MPGWKTQVYPHVCGAAIGYVPVRIQVDPRVYPHVCGAAVFASIVLQCQHRACRSIPTCAGQPYVGPIGGFCLQIRSIPTCAGQPD